MTPKDSPNKTEKHSRQPAEARHLQEGPPAREVAAMEAQGSSQGEAPTGGNPNDQASLARRCHYSLNPKRRLRRLARWLEMCGGIPKVDASGYAGMPFDNADREERFANLDHLLALEIEWACKTAAESIGMKWGER